MKKIILAAVLAASSTQLLAEGRINWTGPYGGVSAGYNATDFKTDYGYTSTAALGPPGFQNVFGPDFCEGFDSPCGEGPFNVTGKTAVQSALINGFIPQGFGSSSTDSGTFAASLGYNLQDNHLLYGIEADLSYMNADKHESVSHSLAGTGDWSFINITNTTTQNARLSSLGTLRARLGYVNDSWLIFGTGGLAYGRVNASTNTTMLDNAGQTTTSNFGGASKDWKAGFTLGAGAEYRISDNVSLKADYLYYKLGSVKYDINALNDMALGQGITATADQKVEGNLARIGLNYHF